MFWEHPVTSWLAHDGAPYHRSAFDPWKAVRVCVLKCAAFTWNIMSLGSLGNMCQWHVMHSALSMSKSGGIGRCLDRSLLLFGNREWSAIVI